MKALRVNGKLSIEALKRRYLVSKDKRERIRWHSLWLIKSGLNAPSVAKVVGRDVKSVRKWTRWYNNAGEEMIKARLNKGKTARLTEEQFKMMEKWLETSAQNGGRWTGELLRQKILEAFKVDYSVDGVYYILHRRLYRVKRPRPYHPKINKREQESFKKAVWTKAYHDAKRVSWSGAKDIF